MTKAANSKGANLTKTAHIAASIGLRFSFLGVSNRNLMMKRFREKKREDRFMLLLPSYPVIIQMPKTQMQSMAVAMATPSKSETVINFAFKGMCPHPFFNIISLMF